MAVLPESMDKLNVQDSVTSLGIIENYIRYMGERIEFSMRNVTKTVSAAGVSSAEIYVLVTAMSNNLSALTSVVNGLSGNINSLTTNQAAMQATLEALQITVGGMQTQLTDLEARVSALEQT